LNLHADALRAEISIVMGDFNSNVIWDERHTTASHTSVVQQLLNIGLESLYHHANSVPQGRERRHALLTAEFEEAIPYRLRFHSKEPPNVLDHRNQ
jgi:hypothetical protein